MNIVLGLIPLLLLAAATPTFAQTSSAQPTEGTLVLTGGGTLEAGNVLDTFLELAGDGGSSILYIRIPRELPKHVSSRSEYEATLRKLFRTDITLLHSNHRSDWDSDAFADAIRASSAVWVSGGNQGHLARLVLDTKSHNELRALLQRGGVYGGQSGGAMIATSFMLRGHADKPALIARNHTRGFGFLQDVVINPHLTERKRENQLVTTVDLYPNLLGIGIDEGAAIVVHNNEFRIIGQGRVAVYDNKPHGSKWFYDLNPSVIFDLSTRTVKKTNQETAQ
ncbi:MAG: cyanophycinase [Gammaproteobacteria bacterium]|nr:cyanophycinase [Gammaproteobacteria bacterium]